MVRGRDACWEHCVLVDATKQKVRCNYCQRDFSGGVYRMKFHLAQIKNKDVVPCTQVPDDVRHHIQILLTTPKKPKPPKKHQKLEVTTINDQDSSASSETRINDESNSHKSIDVHSSPYEQLDSEKQKQENADKKIAAFFIQNAINFAATKSVCYKEMVDSIIECGTGYVPPSYNKMRSSSLLDKVKTDVNDWSNKLREEWRETGCTIVIDCSIGRATSNIVFSITSPRGTLFLKSVDISSQADDSHYLFELIESVISEIGVENVIQVLSNCDSNFIYPARLLTSKYPSLFWNLCVSNCIDKMLEDLSRTKWVSTILEESNSVIRYMHNHTHKFKLPAEAELTRSKFILLRAIVIQEDNLKTVFPSQRFWKSVNEIVNVTEPLLKILRMVDCDTPAIGYIYGKIEGAKMAIKAYYKGAEEKYVEIRDIVDKRWNIQVNSSLHAAAAFLNPSWFYSHKIDAMMRNGFQECMLRMAKEDRDKLEITKEHPIYANAQGALSTEFAVMGRTLNSPGDWWAVYGYEIPTLQRMAVRILSQPCTTNWCKWNWGTFENLHSKRRNNIESDKFSDLVYLQCNLWLQSISRSRDSKCKPINFEEIDVDSEWPTDSESSIPLFDSSWLENLQSESSQE